MKTVIPLTTLLAGAASMAIAPPLDEKIVDHHIHALGVDNGPTVDGTSTRGQWVTSYTNKGEAFNGPTVDGTSTRGQWVTSYSNKKGEAVSGPTIDGTSTRGQWVTSYTNKGDIGSGPTVDETSTRGKWVSSYTGKSDGVDHWLPSGPGYLEVDSLEKGYHAHLLVMHDSSSWLQSGMLNVKRFFQASTV